MDDYYYELAKHEEYKSAILNIQCAITLQFFQNMYEKGEYIYSKVKYGEKGCKVVFGDIRQIKEVLYKVARYFIV